MIFPFLSQRLWCRRAFLGFFVIAGLGGSVALIAGYLCGCVPHSIIAWGLLFDAVLWFPGAFFLPPPLQWVYLAIPVALPLAGPILVSIAFIAFLLSTRREILPKTPVFNTFIHSLDKVTSLSTFTLEEILENDRKIVPAGDIMRWGDVSLKQAVIDRLASEGVSPRAIRLLKGARNDPDEEVRLFATTILTRLEKIYQEKIKELLSTPDAARPWAELGKVHFDYAHSGLVGQTLAQVHLHEGLSAYLKAIRNEEQLDPEELLSVGTHAIAEGDPEVEHVVLDRLFRTGSEKERKVLEWMKLYEEGRWLEMQNDMRRWRTLVNGIPIPDNLEIWVSEDGGSGRA